MTLDPNKYKLVFPTVCKMWEKGMTNPDFEYVISEIATITHIEAAAICLIIEHFYKDARVEPVRIKLQKFYKYNIIMSIDDQTK